LTFKVSDNIDMQGILDCYIADNTSLLCMKILQKMLQCYVHSFVNHVKVKMVYELLPFIAHFHV